MRLLNFDFTAPIGPGITQVGDMDDWTFVVEQDQDGWTLTVSRVSGKMLVDGTARGNVEKSLAIVKKMMTEQEIDPRTIHYTLKILKRAYYVYNHFNHDMTSDECGCKEKEGQREQEAKLLEEQQRRQRQRLVSKVLLDGLYDDSTCLSKIRGCQHIMKDIWIWILNPWEEFPADLEINLDDLNIN